MWYDVAGVLILKFTVCPTSTLIDVANPWIVESPAPLTCQSLGESPVKVFSHAITLVTGGPHGLAAAARPAPTTTVTTLATDSTPKHKTKARPTASGRETRRAPNLTLDTRPPPESAYSSSITATREWHSRMANHG
jgi:hypothetical protein